jgi:hypothetical protein
MRVRDLNNIRKKYKIGQIINTVKQYSSERSEIVEAKIIGKYKYFCLVQDAVNPKYRWCVYWTSISESVSA